MDILENHGRGTSKLVDFLEHFSSNHFHGKLFFYFSEFCILNKFYGIIKLFIDKISDLNTVVL